MVVNKVKGLPPIDMPGFKVCNAKKIVIDGKEYGSLNKAVLATRVNFSRMKVIHRELLKTKLSSIDREVSISHMMTFSLPKEL